MSQVFTRGNYEAVARRAPQSCLTAVLVAFFGFTWGTALSQTQPNDNDDPGTQVLTRGPVHEAFAGIVTFNPEPGVVVTKAPPDTIEELPPEERPEGDNVTWIPGYWAWDDERTDFLWVSGTWRALPPGRQWMAGYWGKSTQGFQWTSGYWADATARETTYLPSPPATVEVGPNIAAPSPDYGWSPGCWIWYQGRYAWRPGYWAPGRADWDWTPAHYVWSPRGCIFIGGFWDYPVERRGVIFAPIYFEAGVYSRRGYAYSPRIVIDLGVFTDHLFLRPRYHHYYFGDYYAPSYHQGGFYASFSFQSGHHGYDPIYSHHRWEHRQDRDWGRRVEVSYQDRRDHEAARPPRTWAAQRTIIASPAAPRENRVVMATPIDQLTKRKDSPMRFQPVAKEERVQLSKRGREVQTSREQRRTLEAQPAVAAVRQPGEVAQPASVQRPNSPIVDKPVNQSERRQAPPEAQRAPKPDLKVQPKSKPSGRPPNVEKASPPRESRQPESEKKPSPAQSEPAPREKQIQPESPPRGKEPGGKATEDSPRNAPESAKRAAPESERRVNDSPAKASEALQPSASNAGTVTQPTAELRVKEPAPIARNEPPRNASGLEKKAQRVTEQPATKRPVAPGKGATRLLKNEHQKPGKGKPVPSETPPASTR